LPKTGQGGSQDAVGLEGGRKQPEAGKKRSGGRQAQCRPGGRQEAGLRKVKGAGRML
jgi:hypothetical protein